MELHVFVALYVAVNRKKRLSFISEKVRHQMTLSLLILVIIRGRFQGLASIVSQSQSQKHFIHSDQRHDIGGTVHIQCTKHRS